MRGRISGAAVLLAMMAGGHASASSILVLEAMEGDIGPSMQVLAPLEAEAPDVVPGEAPAAVSTSVAAVGEPAVTQERTAALPSSRSRPRFNPETLVIRGGMSGTPIAQAAPSAPASEPPRQAAPRRAPAPAAPTPVYSSPSGNGLQPM